MIILVSSLFGFMGLTIIFGSDSVLNWVAVIVVLLQQAVAVGRNVAPSLPFWLRTVYLYLKLLVRHTVNQSLNEYVSAYGY